MGHRKSLTQYGRWRFYLRSAEFVRRTGFALDPADSGPRFEATNLPLLAVRCATFHMIARERVGRLWLSLSLSPCVCPNSSLRGDVKEFLLNQTTKA